jgi:hypothetical protein
VHVADTRKVDITDTRKIDITDTRKVDIRLPGKGNSNFHGARPVH